MRDALIVTIGALFVAVCGGRSMPAADTGAATESLALELVGQFIIPTGARFPPGDGLEIGGLSGLAPHPRGILAVSDARDDNRLFLFGIGRRDGALQIEPAGMTRLEDATRETSAAGAPDFEAIALDATRVFLAAEGASEIELRVRPAIMVYDHDGQFLEALPTPPKFMPETTGPQTTGVRNNEGFESLTRTPDGRLITASEGPLVQDDDVADFTRESRVRILEYVERSGRYAPAREWVYPVDPVPRPRDFAPDTGINGLVELVALDDTRLLALERSFVTEGPQDAPRRVANSIRLYRVELDGADDVSSISSLRSAASAKAVSKQLVADLDTIAPRLPPELAALENFEGMCFGPTLSDGSRTLVLVSDNNFSTRQRTAFLLFRIVER